MLPRPHQATHHLDGEMYCLDGEMYCLHSGFGELNLQFQNPNQLRMSDKTNHRSFFCL